MGGDSKGGAHAPNANRSFKNKLDSHGKVNKKSKNKSKNNKNNNSDAKKASGGGKGSQPSAHPTAMPPSLSAAAGGSSKKGGSVLAKMREKLQGGHFRWINEQLYTTGGEKALSLMKHSPELYSRYHQGIYFYYIRAGHSSSLFISLMCLYALAALETLHLNFLTTCFLIILLLSYFRFPRADKSLAPAPC